MPDRGPERVPASALIPVRGTNFASMTSASQISAMEATAPTLHRRLVSAMCASGKVTEDQTILQRAQPKPTVSRMFARGSVVRHKETGKKLTIVQANIGYTKKSHTPVHRLCDKNGNVCQEKETKLNLIP